MILAPGNGARRPREAGELAQLARALASHARGRRFESDILHSQVSMTFDEVNSSLIVPHFSLDKIFDILTQAKL